MFNVEKLIEEYAESVKIRHDNEFVFVTPPFYHIESDESIALRFSEAEDGRPVISDCGTTRDYLEITYVNLKDYQAKLNAIKERFFIEEEDGAFIMAIPSLDLPTVCKYVGYFIQAVSVIANIDL